MSWVISCGFCLTMSFLSWFSRWSLSIRFISRMSHLWFFHWRYIFLSTEVLWACKLLSRPSYQSIIKIFDPIEEIKASFIFNDIIDIKVILKIIFIQNFFYKSDIFIEIILTDRFLFHFGFDWRWFLRKYFLKDCKKEDTIFE